MKNEKNLPLRDIAYNYIKNKIMKCKYLPGYDISEADIANEIGISRTPVREAIQMLNRDGFIIIYPRKGMIVAPITMKEIQEVFDIRMMVEAHIITKNFRNISKEYLLEMKQVFMKVMEDAEFINYDEYYDLDFGFHNALIKSSNNDLLIRFMEKIYDTDYRIRALSTQEREDIQGRANPEHLEMIDTILAGNPEKIDAIIKAHLKNAKQAALDKIYK